MADNKIGFLNADDMVILNECLSADSCGNAKIGRASCRERV